MHCSYLLLAPLFPITTFASFNKARATGNYKCHLTPTGLIINEEIVPLQDYILEVITAYGKHTSSATAAFDTFRYAGLQRLDSQNANETITLTKNAGYSGVMILLRTAKERATGLEEQLRCFDDALGDGSVGGMTQEKRAMKKVVQVVLEEVEHTRTKLSKQKKLLGAAMKKPRVRSDAGNGKEANENAEKRE